MVNCSRFALKLNLRRYIKEQLERRQEELQKASVDNVKVRAKAESERLRGRGLHSSTFQLNLSRYSHKIHPIHPSTPTVTPQTPLK